MTKRILFGILLVAVIVGSYLWLSLRQPEESKYTGPVEKITLAAGGYLTGALVYVAEDQGFFKRNGLDVTIKHYMSGKACADALIAGEADIATSADNVFVSNSFEHADLRVFGTVALAQIKEMVARKDKGITTVNDLRGKKIGVTKKSGAEFLLGVFLTFNSISLQDVKLVDLKPVKMLGAISKGDVDAVITWDPYLYDIKKELGDSAVSWFAGEEFYYVLLVKEDWIKSHPKAAKRFIKAIVAAEDYVKDNPLEAKEFVSKKFNYESDFIDYSWPRQEFAVILGQAMLTSFEDKARWRIKNKLTDKSEVLNYLDFIYMDALEEVKPDAVTIIR